MKRVFLFVMFALLSLAIASCGNPKSSLQPPSPSSAAPTASPPPTSQPVVETTSPPSATPSAAVSSCLEYYVVEKDGLYGVVDGNGNPALPLQYERVQIVYQREDDAAFLLAPKDASPRSSPFEETQPGKIVRYDGTLLSENEYVIAAGIKPGFIEVATWDSEHGQLFGIIKETGEVVIPCIYGEVKAITGGFIGLSGHYQDQAAGDRVERQIDAYDESGKKIASSKGYVYGWLDDYIVGDNGRGTVSGLLNINLNWVVAKKYSSIIPAGNGLFIVAYLNKDKCSETFGIINATGKTILPIQYSELRAQYDSNDLKNATCFTALSKDERTSYVFDLKGKAIQSSERYVFLEISDGITISKDKQSENTGLCQAVDTNGKVLFTARSITYNRKLRLYECIDEGTSVNAVYTPAGSRLSLPASGTIECLEADRFIINACRICDAGGKELGDINLANMRPMGDGKTVCFEQAGDTRKYGIADYNGNIILDVEYISISRKPSQKLFYAQTETMHGLLNENGDWVWSAPGQAPQWYCYAFDILLS